MECFSADVEVDAEDFDISSLSPVAPTRPAATSIFTAEIGEEMNNFSILI